MSTRYCIYITTIYIKDLHHDVGQP